MVNDNVKDNLGKMLKQRRVMVPLTLRELAATSGVSSSHLSRIEKGERFPSTRTLWKIGRPLGLDESELLSMGGYPPIQGSTEAERPDGLKTKVFELCSGKYSSLSELARAMEITVSQIYRVRNGKRGINEEFVIGAVKAFPGYKLDDLFYVTAEDQAAQPKQKLSADSSAKPADVLKDTDVAPVRETSGVGNKVSGNGGKQITRGGIAGRRLTQIANTNKVKKQSQVTSSSRSRQFPISTDTMLTVRAVAKLLNVHINTVRRWSNQRILQAYRIGSRGDRRFRREDIDTFLKEREIG